MDAALASRASLAEALSAKRHSYVGYVTVRICWPVDEGNGERLYLSLSV
jgi:hypothetical protein